MWHSTIKAMGFFIGAAIHDVAQVVGAGYSVSLESGDAATLVKLFRVAMLIPVVALVTVWIDDVSSRCLAASRPNAPGAAILSGVFVLVRGKQHWVDSHALSHSLAGIAPVLLLAGDYGTGYEDVAARYHRDWS